MKVKSQSYLVVQIKFLLSIERTHVNKSPPYQRLKLFYLLWRHLNEGNRSFGGLSVTRWRSAQCLIERQLCAWCETHGLGYSTSAIGIVVILRGDFYAFSASQNPLGGNPRVNMSFSYIFNELCFTGVVRVHFYSTGEGMCLPS